MTYHTHDTFLGFSTKTGDVRAVFWRTMNLLRDLGFKVVVPARIARDYPMLSRSHRGGVCHHLEFEAKHSAWANQQGGTLQIEFFQNVVHENPHGGQYDFQKLGRMPYLIRLRFIAVSRKIRALWDRLGAVDETKPDESKLSPLELIALKIRSNGHFQGGDPLVDWKPTTPGNGRDRDGRMVAPGDVKCFYTYRNHLMQGRAFPNLNNMWHVAAGAAVFNVCVNELFDWQTGTPRRRPLDPVAAQRKVGSALARAVEMQHYERAIVLRDLLARA